MANTTLIITSNDICITIFYNFCDNFLFRTYIIFLLSLSIALVFVFIPHFLCELMVASKVIIKMIV